MAKHLSSRKQRSSLLQSNLAKLTYACIFSSFLAACGSNTENPTIATSIPSERLYGVTASYDYMQNEIDTYLEPSWTEENTRAYQEVLEATDLYYDETTVGFINTEAKPASENIFRQQRSELYDAQRTNVVRSESEGESQQLDADNSPSSSSLDKQKTTNELHYYTLQEVKRLAHGKAPELRYISKWHKLSSRPYKLAKAPPQEVREELNAWDAIEKQVFLQFTMGSHYRHYPYYAPYYYDPFYPFSPFYGSGIGISFGLGL